MYLPRVFIPELTRWRVLNKTPIFFPITTDSSSYQHPPLNTLNFTVYNHDCSFIRSVNHQSPYEHILCLYIFYIHPSSILMSCTQLLYLIHIRDMPTIPTNRDTHRYLHTFPKYFFPMVYSCTPTNTWTSTLTQLSSFLSC